jgi:CRISPR/Cas system-associated exonuclease Cas4 (RecB family)
MTISKILATPLQPLKRISPSRYASLKSCPLREVLASTPGIPKMLPDSPEAKLGTVIHKLLELAVKGSISDLASASAFWDTEVSRIENEMASNPLEHHLMPLSRKCRNYEVKRSQCFLMVESVLSTVSKSAGRAQEFPSGMGTEIWVESPDRKVGGKIDAVRENHGIEVIDYKTGAVLQEVSDPLSIREEYKTQLKLYAALYFLTFEKWPSRLLIVGLSSEEHGIEFDHEECLVLLEEAVKRFDQINESIKKGFAWEDLANPSPGACKYCPFRPLCKAYLETEKEGQGWPVDVVGTVQTRTLLKNGLRVTLVSNGKSCSVRGLSAERHRILEDAKADVIILNLYRDTSPNCHLESPMTVCYELSR